MSDLEDVLRRGMSSLGASWDSDTPRFEPQRSALSATGRRTHRRRSRTAAVLVVVAATAMTYVVAPQWIHDWFAKSEAECGTAISADARLVASASTPSRGVLQMWIAPTDGGGVTTAVTFSPPGGAPAVGPAMCGANGRRLSKSSTLAVDIRQGGRRGLSVFESQIPGTGSFYVFGYVRDGSATVTVTWRDDQSIEVPATGGYYIAAHPADPGVSNQPPRVSSVEAFDESGALVVRRSLPR